MFNKGTGILLFSRLPKAEAKWKALSGDTITDQVLWENLYNHTLAVAKNTTYPVVIYNEEQQKGISFAEKITNAISESFDAGFDNLIVLGTDCPSLSSRQIVSAADALQKGRHLVIGPDQRGGVYLLAVNKQSFCKKSFLHFQWQSRELLSDLKRFGKSYTYFILHSRLGDVNSIKDAISTASAYNSSASWRTLVFRCIISSSIKCSEIFDSIRSALPTSNLSLRAPPCIAIAI